MLTLVLTTAAVALLAYLVGRSTLPLFFDRGAESPPYTLQLELLLGNVLISVVGLVLAEGGVFTLARLLVALGVLGGTGLVVGRRRNRFAPAPAYGRHDLIGVALVLGAYLWAFPPMDTALFASDSSVYLTTGIHVAEHGSLVVDDPTIALLSPAQRARWFPPYRPNSGTPPFLRVGGGLLLSDLQSGLVLPAFQPLLSVWAAVFYALGGDGALAGPTPYFGALFLWAFASFAAHLAGGWTAIVALGLLTSLVPQYWYSRFLMPEIPSQYFLWAGLWTAALSSSSRGTHLGALAGLAIGVAGLMRLDVLVHVAAGLALWKAIVPWRAWPAGPGFVPALAAMTAYAGFHQILFPTHYAAEIAPRVLVVLDALRLLHALDRRSGALAVCALVGWIAVCTLRNSSERAVLLGRTFRVFAALVFAAYAFAIVATASPDVATNLAWLKIYAGWPLMVVALVGGGYWFRGTRNPAEQFTLLFAAVAVAQLFFYPPVSPQPLWAIRRMLRIALPFMAIAAALALTRIAARWHRALAVVAATALLAFGPRLAFSYRQPAYEHTMTHVRSLGALLPRGSVVLGDPAFLAESQLHIALWMTRDTPAFFVSGSDGSALAELRMTIPDRPMFWVGPPGRTPLASPDLRVTPVATYAFSIGMRRMEPYDERDDLGLRAISLTLYRLDQ